MTTLTASIKIVNSSEDYVYLLLFGEPPWIDDAGGHFSIVAGVGACPTSQPELAGYS